MVGANPITQLPSSMRGTGRWFGPRSDDQLECTLFLGDPAAVNAGMLDEPGWLVGRWALQPARRNRPEFAVHPSEHATPRQCRGEDLVVLRVDACSSSVSQYASTP